MIKVTISIGRVGQIGHSCSPIGARERPETVDTCRFCIIHLCVHQISADEELLKKPLLFTPAWSEQTESFVYTEMASYKALHVYLQTKLEAYNQVSPHMHIVLFHQAMEHVCRICRILCSPRGNALLVGVGGSGKQSLAKLASFICNMHVFQVLRSGRGAEGRKSLGV